MSAISFLKRSPTNCLRLTMKRAIHQKRRGKTTFLQSVGTVYDSYVGVHITPITMVYGTYNYTYWGLKNNL